MAFIGTRLAMKPSQHIQSMVMKCSRFNRCNHFLPKDAFLNCKKLCTLQQTRHRYFAMNNAQLQRIWKFANQNSIMKSSILLSCVRENSAAVAAPSNPVIKAKVRGIQKDLSPLTTKRVRRRRTTKDTPGREEAVFDVMAHSTAEEYQLEALLQDLQEQGLYGVVPLPDDLLDAICVEAQYRVGDEPREIFFFRDGAVIFWNMPQVERESVLRFLSGHQEGSYNSEIVSEEYEHVEFMYTEQATRLQNDEFQLQSPAAPEQKLQLQLEKYAFSNALALSVKLAIWEASLERYVDSIEYVLQDLKDGKKIKMSEAEVLRKNGELLTLRHCINLSSDLLDTPDFYWDRDQLEALYVKTCNNFNINRRTKVMNEKLTHCYELTQLLLEHLKDKHHTRLEWMIILLILIEVVFAIEAKIEYYLEKKNNPDAPPQKPHH